MENKPVPKKGLCIHPETGKLVGAVLLTIATCGGYVVVKAWTYFGKKRGKRVEVPHENLVFPEEN